jgi:glycosyltransferase involved in cell wall biosynthesis
VIYNYITKDGHTYFKKFLHGVFSGVITLIESYYVLRKNGLKSIKIITSPNKIKSDDIVIVHYYYFNQMKSLKKIKATKVVLGNHFIKLGYDGDFEKQEIAYFVNEIDLKNNPFIIRYFNLKNVNLLVMPYIFQSRFIIKKCFRSRLNKVMAIGTLSTVKGAGYEEYETFMGTPWVQPMRKEILDNKESLSDIIDSYISYIYEDAKEKNIKDSGSKLKKILNNIFYSGWNQKKYYSFDMVDKFNEYRMFVCPEEIVGMPGIGFVEGMACGCAYIGLDSDMYKCLGLIPSRHYIAYNGTLEDLRSKCEYYIKHEDLLESISRAGSEFVRKHFNCETVAHSFFNTIMMNGG